MTKAQRIAIFRLVKLGIAAPMETSYDPDLMMVIIDGGAWCYNKYDYMAWEEKLDRAQNKRTN